MPRSSVAIDESPRRGEWTKPRSRWRFNAFAISGLLLWAIFAAALEGKAAGTTDGLPYNIAALERMDPTDLAFTCTGGQFCESGFGPFEQPFSASITLPENLGMEQDLLLVFAGFYGGSSTPPTCDLSPYHKLGASIKAGSVTGATLTAVDSPAGAGTPLCDSYGQTLQALLLEGAPGEKLTVEFTVDVAATSPEVTQLAMPLAGFATPIPEPRSLLLLALGLVALRAGARSPQTRRT